MRRAVFCPQCQSMQPLGMYQEEDPSQLWCGTCGNRIEGPRLNSEAGSGLLTILCIDDDAIVLTYCSSILEQHGFRVLVASDGITGIETARKEMPDLILLDIVMPRLNGFSVCRRLKADPLLRGIPIILLTVLNNPNLAFKGLLAGATHTMRKPFSPELIVETIERVLGGRPRLSKC